MKVAVIQMNCIADNKKANFEIAGRLIEQAGENGAKLVVLPEIFNCGYCCTKDWELSETGKGETYDFLKLYAEKYNCAFVGGFVEKAGIPGLVYNSLLFVSPEGKTGIYRKMYLWGAEKNRFIKGEQLKMWELDGVKIAPQICYEVGFSENAKLLALSGAHVLCYSSAFGNARYYAWDIATRARALETGTYVLASNHSNVEGDILFCGHSRIVNPKGEILCETTRDNDVVIWDIDLNMINVQRDAIPYLRDINSQFIASEYAKISK